MTHLDTNKRPQSEAERNRIHGELRDKTPPPPSPRWWLLALLLLIAAAALYARVELLVGP